jgi:hypothetical protein
MPISPDTEYKKLEELLKDVLSRVIDIWSSGEGDLLLEIRDDGGDKKAKISGGKTTRIK